jgi:RimJ/RimL family protein N-acetyltransferase
MFEFDWQKPELAHQQNTHAQDIGLPLDTWQACDRPPKSIMHGQYCRLEPFDVEKHSDGLFNAFLLDTDDHNWTYLPYGPFKHSEDFQNWCREQCLSDDPLFHTVLDQASGQLSGLASYLRITPEVGVIEVGHIHFSPLIQGRRQATEAMFLMMRRVFDELGYRRYEWKCDALNAPSCRAARRFGFQFEGIFRQATMYKGRNRDTAWFAITDCDWPVLRAGFKAWLATDNFDAAEQQIRSLQACIANH